MPSTQQKVIDYLRINPYSTGVEIAAGLVGLGKTQSAIDSALKELRVKGFCRKGDSKEKAWRYELTDKLRANHYSSVLSLSVTVSAPIELLPEARRPVVGHRPFVYSPYSPETWEAARPGADAHQQYKSRGV